MHVVFWVRALDDTTGCKISLIVELFLLAYRRVEGRGKLLQHREAKRSGQSSAPSNTKTCDKQVRSRALFVYEFYDAVCSKGRNLAPTSYEVLSIRISMGSGGKPLIVVCCLCKLEFCVVLDETTSRLGIECMRRCSFRLPPLLLGDISTVSTMPLMDGRFGNMCGSAQK